MLSLAAQCASIVSSVQVETLFRGILYIPYRAFYALLLSKLINYIKDFVNMEIKTTLKEQISNKVESLLKNWTFDSFAVDGDSYMATFNIFGEQNLLTVEIEEDTDNDCYDVIIEAKEYGETDTISIIEESDIDHIINAVQDVIKECVDDYFYYTFN